MKEEVFYKHVRETTFTKDYTVCGKVVDINAPDPNYIEPEGCSSWHEPIYELHIGVYVFPVDELFIKKQGTMGSLLEATSDPLVKIKVDEYSLHTFLDFCKTLVPKKAVKKKVYISYTVE